jgi:hypothetical protein
MSLDRVISSLMADTRARSHAGIRRVWRAACLGAIGGTLSDVLDRLREIDGSASSSLFLYVPAGFWL